MYEDTPLGKKVSAAKSWRQLIAIVRHAREVNSQDRRGFYHRGSTVCSPGEAVNRIDRIRNGELSLLYITRNYGLRSKVAELMSAPPGAGQQRESQ